MTKRNLYLDKINTENFVENNLIPESKINFFLANNEDAFFFKSEPTNEVINALTDFTYYHYLYKDLQPEKYKARNELFELVPYYKGKGHDLIHRELGTDVPHVHLESSKKDEDFQPKEKIRYFDKNVYSQAIYDSKEFIKKLNKNEINLLSYWSINGSQEIRNEKNRTKRTKIIKTINQAINKSILKNEKILYRGVKFEEFESQKINEYKIGQKIKLKTPKSTTSNPTRSIGFTDFDTNVILEIKAKKAGSISIISSWGASETEYLIPNDHSYTVKNIFHTNYSLNPNDPETIKVKVIQLEQD